MCPTAKKEFKTLGKLSDFLKQKPTTSKPTNFNISQAAKMSGVTETLLTLWMETGRFEPSIEFPPIPPPDRSHRLYEVLNRHREDFPKTYGKAFLFTQADIERLREMVAGNAAAEDKHVAGTNWTIKQLAAAWGLSTDTIRDLFKDEPGILKINRPAVRGKRPKRAYATFTIPEDVKERVQRRLS